MPCPHPALDQIYWSPPNPPNSQAQMTDPLLCPFTLKNLSDVKEDDLAVVYETNPLLSSSSSSDGAVAVECGHKCTLSRLVSYLQDSKACPVCQEANVSVVCDAQSSAQLLKQKESKDCEGRIISFRYGTTSYFLWVPSSPTMQASSYSSLFSKGEINALTRISSVFGVDVEKGLKVCHFSFCGYASMVYYILWCMCTCARMSFDL